MLSAIGIVPVVYLVHLYGLAFVLFVPLCILGF
jgi:hypothetical protein